jgi:hypothetical protein
MYPIKIDDELPVWLGKNENLHGREIQIPIKDGNNIQSRKPVFRLTRQSWSGRRPGLNQSKALFRVVGQG